MTRQLVAEIQGDINWLFKSFQAECNSICKKLSELLGRESNDPERQPVLSASPGATFKETAADPDHRQIHRDRHRHRLPTHSVHSIPLPVVVPHLVIPLLVQLVDEPVFVVPVPTPPVGRYRDCPVPSSAGEEAGARAGGDNEDVLWEGQQKYKTVQLRDDGRRLSRNSPSGRLRCPTRDCSWAAASSPLRAPPSAGRTRRRRRRRGRR